MRAGRLWPDAALGAGRGSSAARQRGLSAAHASDAMGSAVVVQAGGWWWRRRAQIRLWRRELRATWITVGLPYHGSWGGSGWMRVPLPVRALAAGRCCTALETPLVAIHGCGGGLCFLIRLNFGITFFSTSCECSIVSIVQAGLLSLLRQVWM